MTAVCSGVASGAAGSAGFAGGSAVSPSAAGADGAGVSVTGTVASFGRRRERLDQFLPRAFRVRVDELHDALDVFGNRRRFEVEELRPRHADVRDGLVDLEKLQAVLRELLAQLRRDRQREKFLLLPFLADEPLQSAAAQTAARQAGDGERLDRLDDGILVRGAEMFFHFFERRAA